MRSLEPTPEEIASTTIPESPWVRAMAPRVGIEEARVRLAREARLLRVMAPRFRHPMGMADRRLGVRILQGLVGLAGLSGRARRNFARIEVQRREWDIRGLPKSFDGYRILHASDFHLDFDPEVIGRLGKVVAGLEYDLVCLTGDFFDLVFEEESIDQALLADLIGLFRKPVHAVLGNHDILAVGGALEEMGVRVLMNESVRIGDTGGGFLLAGIDDPRYYQVHSCERALAAHETDEPTVLLAHSPQVYREAAEFGVDLVLCGHTHGGQVCLPGGWPLPGQCRCPRTLVSREWHIRGAKGYTSHGCGGCKLPFRFNAPAEATIHTLRSAASGT